MSQGWKMDARCSSLAKVILLVIFSPRVDAISQLRQWSSRRTLPNAKATLMGRPTLDTRKAPPHPRINGGLEKGVDSFNESYNEIRITSRLGVNEERNAIGSNECSSSTRSHDGLLTRELEFMRLVQRAPGLRPLALAVHYSLLPQVVTPALAIIAWMVSLPAAASLICFVCAQDVINTAIKWAVMRPRPLWYSNETGLVAKQGSNSWEADFSFPSAHTQFFSGLALCSFILSGHASLKVALGTTFGLGTLIGITRNFLGVHWPTDTLFGLILGAGLGFLWGKFDPFMWLMKNGSPLLSFSVATALTGGLILLLMLIRFVVHPPDSDEHSTWCANIFSSLPIEERIKTDPKAVAPRPREVRFKVAMLSTIWCTLAFTAFLPEHLPSITLDPARSTSYKVMQTLVGMGGLAGCGMGLKQTIKSRIQGVILSDTTKALCKAFAYAGICAWTFLLSHLAGHRIISIYG